MAKIVNNETDTNIDNRDKYLVFVDKLREEIRVLEEKYSELNNLASDEEDKANSNIESIEELVTKTKILESKIKLKKGYKEYALSLLKLYGIAYIPEVGILYLIQKLCLEQHPNIFLIAGTALIICGAYYSLSILFRKIDCRGIVLPEAEEKLEELINLASTLDEEKQMHLDNVVKYRSERDETDEKITKLENDIEYILNARNQIIGIVLKDAIDSSYVDTSSIDKDLEEKGILMELK